nr:hypothetical protein [Yersinia alsatica]
MNYVDEIVIVDTGSTDSTIDIINSLVSDNQSDHRASAFHYCFCRSCY